MTDSSVQCELSLWLTVLTVTMADSSVQCSLHVTMADSAHCYYGGQCCTVLTAAVADSAVTASNNLVSDQQCCE